MERDGNGWVECELGHRHWGRHGAAGLLLHTVDAEGSLRVLLQHRADWCHHGGTWGLPGGARDSHETVEEAALREAAEETAVDTSRIRVRHTFVDDHGGWSYTTVYADSLSALETVPNEESAALEWVGIDRVDALPLHPGFGHTWPRVRQTPLALVVDTANVLGATANGWWRDRIGATERLGAELVTTRAHTVHDDDVSGVITSVHVVLEGAARDARLPHAAHVVRATGSGDDAVVKTVELLAASAGRRVVVTSDRELKERVMRAAPDTDVRGATWLLRLL